MKVKLYKQVLWVNVLIVLPVWVVCIQFQEIKSLYLQKVLR